MRPGNTTDDPAVRARQRRAVRTAWIVAGIAVTVYTAFLLSGVLLK